VADSCTVVDPLFTLLFGGWMKLWVSSNVGIIGATINYNANAAARANAFNGGHNLHKLTLTTDAYVIPVFPASC